MSSIGYFVIEWPRNYRHVKSRVYSTHGLRQTANKVVEVLAGKRMGRRGRVGGYFSRGIMRWHWFGSKGNQYNPHLNVLVDSGYLHESKLVEIKAALRDGLKCPDLIINFSFRSTPAQMAHTTRYVTRPTFLNRGWDPYMARELFETVNENDVVVPFRNSRAWGDWKQPQVWETSGTEVYETIDKLRNRNECPCCQGRMHWSEPFDRHYLTLLRDMGILKPVIPGYYEYQEPEYKGKFKGVDPVLRINVDTGELEIADYSQDVVYKKTLRGDYERMGAFVQMAKRRVKFIESLKSMGIDWRSDGSEYEDCPEYWGS